ELELDDEDELDKDEVLESPPSRSPRSDSRPSRSDPRSEPRSDPRSDVGRALPAREREPTRTPRPTSPGREERPRPAEAEPELAPVPASLDGPVGLTSHEQPERGPEPSFGSDIMVGSDVVP